MKTDYLKRAIEAALAAGFPVYSSFDTKNLLTFVKDLQNYKKVRLFGSAALSLSLLASGVVEAYQENLRIWVTEYFEKELKIYK